MIVKSHVSATTRHSRMIYEREKKDYLSRSRADHRAEIAFHLRIGNYATSGQTADVITHISRGGHLDWPIQEFL